MSVFLLLGGSHKLVRATLDDMIRLFGRPDRPFTYTGGIYKTRHATLAITDPLLISRQTASFLKGIDLDSVVKSIGVAHVREFDLDLDPYPFARSTPILKPRP